MGVEGGGEWFRDIFRDFDEMQENGKIVEGFRSEDAKRIDKRTSISAILQGIFRPFFIAVGTTAFLLR